MTADGVDPLNEIRAWVRQIYAEVGKPSLRELGRRVGRASGKKFGPVPAASTISEMLSGKRIPSVRTVSRFVQACREYVESNNRPLPASLLKNELLENYEKWTKEVTSEQARNSRRDELEKARRQIEVLEQEKKDLEKKKQDQADKISALEGELANERNAATSNGELISSLTRRLAEAGQRFDEMNNSLQSIVDQLKRALDSYTHLLARHMAINEYAATMDAEEDSNTSTQSTPPAESNPPSPVVPGAPIARSSQRSNRIPASDDRIPPLSSPQHSNATDGVEIDVRAAIGKLKATRNAVKIVRRRLSTTAGKIHAIIATVQKPLALANTKLLEGCDAIAEARHQIQEAREQGKRGTTDVISKIEKNQNDLRQARNHLGGATDDMKAATEKLGATQEAAEAARRELHAIAISIMTIDSGPIHLAISIVESANRNLAEYLQATEEAANQLRAIYAQGVHVAPGVIHGLEKNQNDLRQARNHLGGATDDMKAATEKLKNSHKAAMVAHQELNTTEEIVTAMATVQRPLTLAKTKLREGLDATAEADRQIQDASRQRARRAANAIDNLEKNQYDVYQATQNLHQARQSLITLPDNSRKAAMNVSGYLSKVDKCLTDALGITTSAIDELRPYKETV